MKIIVHVEGVRSLGHHVNMHDFLTEIQADIEDELSAFNIPCEGVTITIEDGE